MKPFEIKNREHKLKVIERLRKDLRALVMCELENADEEAFNISSKSYKDLFGEDATDEFWKEKRKYLDKINERMKENESYWEEEEGI